MLKRVDQGPFGDQDRPFGEMVGQVIDDGRAYAEAELRLLKVRAEVEVDRYRSAALLGGAAVAMAVAALVAFAMTLVIGFARLIGPFGGGAAAVAILGLTAYVLFHMAKQRIAEAHASRSNDEDTEDDDDGR